MIQQVTEGDVLLVAVAQAGNILARLVIKTELTVVKGFHHAADGASSFGYRCESKERIVIDLDVAAVVDGAIRALINYLAMTCHNHLAAGEGMLLHTQAAHRVDLRRQAVVESYLGRDGIAQARGVIMDAVTGLITGFLAIKGQRDGKVSTCSIAAEYGLCGIILGKVVVLISQYHSLDVLIGNGFAVILDLVRLACERHNDILTLLDHSIEGSPVFRVILSYLDDDGVEVAVIQLLGKGAGRTGFNEVKALYLRIIGTAAGKHRCRSVLVADGGHSDAPALQVVYGQNIVVVLDDCDATCRELSLKDCSLL